MAFTDLTRGESEEIWPGDAVFSYRPEVHRFPLHVGIYVGRPRRISGKNVQVRIRGLPYERGADLLGDSIWGTAGNSYQAHFVGRRRDVSRANIGEVVVVSAAVSLEHSRLGSKCEWARPEALDIDNRYPIRDGIPLFRRGTCAQFVEYLYESSGLDLIIQAITHHPNPKYLKRIYPATQMHVFWRGAYALRSGWDPRYEKYPDCLFGTRSQS